MTRRSPHWYLRGWAVAAVIVAAGATRAAPSCRNVTTTSVAFGTYNPVNGAPTDSTGSVSYFCPGALSPVISISAGSSGSFSPRHMTSTTTDVLTYNLYLDAARTTVWGDGTGGSATVNGTVATNPATNTIYGRIFPGQSIAAGSYSDTLTVTINF
jgi:spore coat protein U-like protein